MTTAQTEALITRRVSNGYTEQQSRELLAETLRTFTSKNLPTALVYHGFATVRSAEKLMESIA